MTVHNLGSKTTQIALFPTAVGASTTTGSAIDMSGYEGDMVVLLDAAAGGSAITFAVKLTNTPKDMIEDDRNALRTTGFSDRDIWDIAAVTSFYNMSNRLAAATEMQPNPEYHGMAR